MRMAIAGVLAALAGCGGGGPAADPAQQAAALQAQQDARALQMTPAEKKQAEVAILLLGGSTCPECSVVGRPIDFPKPGGPDGWDP